MRCEWEAVREPAEEFERWALFILGIKSFVVSNQPSWAAAGSQLPPEGITGAKTRGALGCWKG